jgi:polyphosphate kinase
MDVLEAAAFRVTRDADLEVSDEADDLLEAVETELRRRRFGDVVRVEVSSQMSAGMVARLCEALDVDEGDIYTITGLLDLADVSQLASVPRPDLKFDPWVPVVPPRLVRADDPVDMFAEIRRADLLVHLPYEAFASSVEAFVRRSTADRDVVAVKTTVYRTSDESPLVPALVRAAEEGKQSVCLVELKARFDERRNIEWSRALERAGCHVAYGFPNLKIHAKTTLIVRREGDVLRRYAHIGTGNYHAVTARLYEDFGLFTDDEDITNDIADLFNHVTGFGRPQRFRKLLVAPFTLRDGLLEEIRAVVAEHSNDSPGRIFIKVNALTDVRVIDELYAASQAGVQVRVVARSICALRPGVEGLSENIRVTSILGRFLEHSRVFEFEAGAHHSWFFGSADLMPRNLDHRIEVVVPIEDPALRKQLAMIRDLWLADEASAWELGADGSWLRLRPEDESWHGGSQEALMALIRAERVPAPLAGGETAGWEPATTTA